MRAESDGSSDKHTGNEKRAADGFDQTADNGLQCHLDNGWSLRQREREREEDIIEEGLHCAQYTPSRAHTEWVSRPNC